MARTALKDQSQNTEIISPGIDVKAVTARKVILDTQVTYGAESAWSAFYKPDNVGAMTIKINSSGTALNITYTPAVDCWWETVLSVGVWDNQEAAERYLWNYIVMTGTLPTINGLAQPTSKYSIIDTHVNGKRYDGVTVKALWGLTASTAYTATAWVNGTGGAWKYYLAYMSLQGQAWAR